MHALISVALIALIGASGISAYTGEDPIEAETWKPWTPPTTARLNRRRHARELSRRNMTGAFDPAYDRRFTHFDCGSTMNTHASEELKEAHRALRDDFIHGAGNATIVSRRRLRERALERRQSTSNQITIDVAMHIVSTTASAGTVSQDAPQKQLDTLNAAYASTGFQFNLLSTDWTTNDAWALGATDADIIAMKTALRKGTYRTLNIYFHTNLSGGMLGVCSMPSQMSDPNNPNAPIPASNYIDDGCSVNAGTMPGGSMYGYSQGMTAVHETGHWLGLFHVFEGYDCSADGDLIEDTAPQAQSTDGCPPTPPSSCTGSWDISVLQGEMALPWGVGDGLPYQDNIHNIMDYSTDACYTGFTSRQKVRMADLWGLYRNGL